MNKKIFKQIIFSLLLIIGGFSGFSLTGEAAENTTITFNYADWDTLTTQQQANVVKDIPQIVTSTDEETYTLVYQKVATNTLITESQPLQSVSPTVLTNSNNQNVLPQTGVENNHWVLFSGTIFTLVAIALFIWKRKQVKQLFVLLILLGGTISTLGVATQAEAEELSPAEIEHVIKGTQLTKEVKNIEGYTYVGYLKISTKENEAPDSTVDSNIHTQPDNTTDSSVEPTPEPIGNGQVEVFYQTIDGTTLSESVLLEGKVGETFQVDIKDFEGYSYKNAEGPLVGTFDKEKQVVTVFYEPFAVAAPITIHYVDDEGNVLHTPTVLSGVVGKSYDATIAEYQLQIEGYVLDESQMPDNTQGIFTAVEQTITYVYQRDTAQLVIRFVDSEGNPFTVPDFTTMKNGDLVPLYPNLASYTVRSTIIDGVSCEYQQNETVNDIVLEKRIGDSYTLPENFEFNIYNEKGESVPYIASPDPNGTISGVWN